MPVASSAARKRPLRSRPGIPLQRSRRVAVCQHLRQVYLQKCRDRALRLVLVDVPQLVGEQAATPLGVCAQIDPFEQRQPGCVAAEEAGQRTCSGKRRIVRNGNRGDSEDAHPTGERDADLGGEALVSSRQRAPCSHDVLALCFSPRDGVRQQVGERSGEIYRVEGMVHTDILKRTPGFRS